MKHVKYLRKFGWEPVVITTEAKNYPWLDKSLMKNIPSDTHIYRIPVVKTCLINDKAVLWIPYVLRSVSSIIRKEKPAVVFLTGGPFFPLILGPIIKKWFKVPYVIDFRDPWRLAERGIIKRKGIKNWASRNLTNILEPRIIRGASCIIFATEPMCRAYIYAYKNEIQNKFITITNGYDSEDFYDIKPIQFREFTIIYTGKWYSDVSGAFMNITNLFKAIKIVHEKGKLIRLIHIGKKEKKVTELVQALDICSIVNFVGQKSYEECIAYIKGADLTIAIGEARLYGTPAKLFDYIGCRKRILALAPSNSVVAELIGKMPFAKCVHSNNPIDIAVEIEEINKGKLKNANSIEFSYCYEREHLTSILAGVLDEAING